MPLPILLNVSFLYLVLCGLAGFLGRKRRIGFWGFFFLSILVTPLITASLIYFAAQPRTDTRARRVAPRRG